MGTTARKARLDLTNPHVIRNEAEYEAAVAEIDALTDQMPEPGSQDDERLELLAVLVSAYEAEHSPMPPASGPRDVVRFLFDQHQVSASEAAELFGSRSRVSEFFAGKRPLSRAQIAALRDRFGISADLLMESTRRSHQ